MEEAQAGIKIARRNINNLRYADDTTCMAESEEELKSLLMTQVYYETKTTLDAILLEKITFNIKYGNEGQSYTRSKPFFNNLIIEC